MRVWDGGARAREDGWVGGEVGGGGGSKLQGLYNKESWEKEGGEEEEKGEGSTSVGRVVNCCKRGGEKEEGV